MLASSIANIDNLYYSFSRIINLYIHNAVCIDGIYFKTTWLKTHVYDSIKDGEHGGLFVRMYTIFVRAIFWEKIVKRYKLKKYYNKLLSISEQKWPIHGIINASYCVFI